MVSSGENLTVRPKAETSTVEDLVDLVIRGNVRIPSFQRDLKWNAQDVLELYDSIYRGYPIGVLLMREGPAHAARLSFGPLRIDAPETSNARWVIDGQQRLVALTAGMARRAPMPTTPDDPYVVYFDAAEEQFVAPSKSGDVPDVWIPATKLLDGSELSEWIFDWAHGQDADLRRAAFDAGKRLRQYRVPQYVVTTDDEDLLKDIFRRVNKSGKSLDWTDVYNALYGDEKEPPSTLSDLADELSALGMGTPTEKQMLSCVVAHQGLDVTRNVSTHNTKNPDALRDGVQQALPAIRRVFSFLRDRAEIPHLRLLPRSEPLTILTRFFGLYPDPSARSVELLVRWTWRTLLGGFELSRPTLLRRGVTLIESGDESPAVQVLLKQVRSDVTNPFSLPDRFDSRSAESRLALLGLVSLQPKRLRDGGPVDVAGIIEENDRHAFRRIWSSGTSSPANRLLLPGTGVLRSQLQDYVAGAPDPGVLASHAISDTAARALLANDRDTFIREREAVMEEAVRDTAARLAAWGRSDRPSIQSILTQATG